LRGHGRVMGAPHAMVAERSVRYLSRTLRCSLASAADRITRGRNRHAHGVAGLGADTHAPGMFAITEAEAAAIRVAFQQSGELSAVVELRRLFPGVTDNAQARACVRTIASWKPLPLRPVKRKRTLAPS